MVTAVAYSHSSSLGLKVMYISSPEAMTSLGIRSSDQSSSYCDTRWKVMIVEDELL